MRLTLRQKLIVLVLVVLIPLTAAIGYQIVHLYRHLRSESVERAIDEAEFASLRIEQFERRLVEQLNAAGSAALEEGMPRERVPAYFAQMSARDEGVVYALFDSQGNLLSGRESGPPTIAAPPSGVGDETVVRTVATGVPTQRGLLVYTPIRSGRDILGVGAARAFRPALERTLPLTTVRGVVLVTDGDGRIVYSNSREPISDAVAAGLPTVRSAVSGVAGSDAWMRVPGLDARHVGAQLPFDGMTVGFYADAAQAFEHIGDEAALLTAAVIATVILSAEFSRRYAGDILADLSRLSSATKRLAVGDFDVDLPSTSDDEIGKLAQDFMDMRKSLQEAFASEALVAEAAAKLGEASTIRGLAEVAAEYAGRLLDLGRVAVTVLDPDGEPRVFGQDGQGQEIASAAELTIPYKDLKGTVEIGRLPEEAGGGMLATFPLRQASALLGRIDVVLPADRLRDSEHPQLELISSLAGQTATALANVILYERERLISDTLQDSLLTVLPRDPELEFGLQYRPATVGMRIGGDFYDFIATSQGLIVIVGDISGKGLSAARQTSVSKIALRSFAIDDPSPDLVLVRANAALTTEFEAGTFVTAFCALLDTDSETVSYSTAGHPPPMVLRLGGEVESLEMSGPPLGVVEDAEYPLHRVSFEPGETLVVVSDGITEARDAQGNLFGEPAVARVIAQSAGTDADGIAENIVRAAENHARGRLEDDLTVVVVSFAHPEG